MISFFRYQRNGLPYGLITVHEFLVRDIFSYFEKSRFVRKKTRNARKAINAALRFARKKEDVSKQKDGGGTGCFRTNTG